MRALLCLALLILPAAASAESILFVGNSFTFGATSPVLRYRADSVTDLNGEGIGGVPALFKLFATEAGLDYRVSLETASGQTLKWHWESKRAVLDAKWDNVVLQDYSVLDPDKPGDPANLVTYSGRLASLFKARNPRVKIGLVATWSRPDQTFLASGHWSGRPITQMALDVRRAYDLAKTRNPAISRVHPVGEAFNCAIATGLADPNPYDGLTFGQVDLWGYDQYHASAAGYYLEALTIFAGVTGKDPRKLGRREIGADELGLSPDVAERLQTVAWQSTLGGGCPAAEANLVNKH